jgi:hypothetical protein
MGEVSTVAGTGQPGYVYGNGAGAQFYAPLGLFVDAQRNLLVADCGNSAIRRLTF